jgi:predicted outer membrane repeat protein
MLMMHLYCVVLYRAVGGIYAINFADVQLHNTTLAKNAATAGAAIRFTDWATGYVSQSRFFNNTSFNRGGAILMDQHSNITFDYCVWQDNAAGTGHGGALIISEFAVGIFRSCNWRYAVY